MLKVALLVATLGVAACTTMDAGATPSAGDAPACGVASAPDPACVPRAVDVNGDGVLSAAELAAAASTPAGDWAAYKARHGAAGLDFKDAALDPAPPPLAEGSPSRRFIPALLALAALVVLLRRRPR